jgi:hypothetical protein
VSVGCEGRLNHIFTNCNRLCRLSFNADGGRRSSRCAPIRIIRIGIIGSLTKRVAIIYALTDIITTHTLLGEKPIEGVGGVKGKGIT